MMTQLDNFKMRMYAAQTARNTNEQLHNITLALEVLGDVVKALDDRMDQLESAVSWSNDEHQA